MSKARVIADLMVPAVRTPNNLSPAASATDIASSGPLNGSDYFSLYGVPLAGSQFQVATDTSFASPTVTTGDVIGVAHTIPGGTLALSSSYYWRTRQKDAEGKYSSWSSPTLFTTAANSVVVTPAATPAAFGDAFEGGFYAGLIWNELTQSSTTLAMGSGSKVFAVVSMTNTPIVYVGQAIEVRSRANPTNKMIGLVTGAVGTNLTVNVTGVGGSGSFSDWSIMAQYRIIVSPKATGENTNVVYKNAATADPTACGTLSEGRASTLAMVAAGSSTVYPAAHWCNNLNISGRADWYLPARDELELCWRNLKPTVDNNYSTADRPTGATPNYMNLGSYGDTSNAHGLSNNTSPAFAGHSTGVPPQVAVGKNFRTGESEAFTYSAGVKFLTSTEYSVSAPWIQFFNASGPGIQDGQANAKTSAYYVRAIRRSMI